MRNSVISDTDGSAEFQKVELEPQNWCVGFPATPVFYTEQVTRAWLAKLKKVIKGPTEGDTAETLAFEISRLEKLNAILKGMTMTEARRISTPGLRAFIHFVLQKSDLFKNLTPSNPAPPPAEDMVVTLLTARGEYQEALVAWYVLSHCAANAFLNDTLQQRETGVRARQVSSTSHCRLLYGNKPI